MHRRPPEPHVWKGMPVMELLNHTCNFENADQTAAAMARVFKQRGMPETGFYLFRVVWVNPTQIIDTMAALHRQLPDLNFEVLDPHAFFAHFREFQHRRPKP